MFRFSAWWPKPKTLRRRRAAPKRLDLVLLEDRSTPATFTVTSTADTGAGTLRNQIIAANAAVGADMIAFDATVFATAKTITLTSGEIAITGDLSISGPAASLTVSGNSSSRIFNINDSITGTAIAVTLNDLTLTKGVTSGVNDGAAIFIQDENVTLTNCTLTGNSSADTGGALRQESGGSLTISGCTVSTNTSASSGGALSLAGGPTVSISNSTFASNIGAAGGAVNLFQGGSVVIAGSTFNFNQATTGQGGAIFLNGSMTSAFLRNSTVHSNLSALSGGGVMFGSSSAGTLAIQNSTITGNNATGGDGGGVARAGGTALITLTSSIVFGNLASTTADELFTTGQITASRSLIGTSTGVATFTPDAFTNSNLGVNPNLGSLQNNGGPTQTRMPNATSLAVDNGSNPALLTTDQRGPGYLRQRGPGVDIGAVELPADFVVTNANNSGAGSLRQAILDANTAIGFDTIAFDSAFFATARTITMSGGEMLISEGLTIDGPDAELTINANNASRIFRMEGANTVGTTLSDLRLINGNVTGTNDGGAILVAGLGGVQNWTNLSFASSASADLGGAVAVIATAASVTMDGCHFAGNSAVTGGGVFLIGGATLIVRSSTFSQNSVTGQGGAISIFGTSAFSLANSTLSANTAATGGAISWNTSGNNNTLNNCTITGNKATSGNGGGVFVFAGTTNFTSTIISDNIGANGPDIFSPGTTNVNFSAVGNAAGFTLTGASNLAFDTNLLLGPLQDNGGFCPTHLPAVNSPLLGKGSNPTGLAFDQRGSGFPRARGGSVDIGAVEVGQFVVTNTNASGAGSLLQATLDANAALHEDTITFDPNVFATNKSIIPSATLTLTDDTTIAGPAATVTISGNLARRIIEITGGTLFNFNNLTLTLGSAAGNGGAILVNAAGSQQLTMTNASLLFNTATGTGGAVEANNDDLFFTDSTLSSNRTTGATQDGGAINISGTGGAQFTRCILANNSATGDGGAIANQAGGSFVQFFDSSASNNSATGMGGGIYFKGATAGTLFLIRNSTLSDNTAASFGGGVAWVNSSGTLTIQNSTITDNTSNTAAGGGGVSVESGTGALSIESSIISGNINAGAPDIDNPNTTKVKTSAIGDNLGFAKTDLGGNLPFQPHANLKLGVLTNNGGPTLTHLPATNSPLVNAGSNPASLTTDQRGFPRGSGGGIDIGSTDIMNTVVRNTNNSGLDSLRQIISETNLAPGAQTITFDSTVFATAKTITLTTGELEILDAITITGPSAGVTISANKASRVIDIGQDVPGFNTALANLTIRDGTLFNELEDGAGIRVSRGNLTLTNCSLIGNSTAGDGGAIGALIRPDLIVVNSTIRDNTAHDGGGIAFSGGLGTLTMSESLLGNNTAENNGGGLHLVSADLSIVNSTMTDNTAAEKGGGFDIANIGQPIVLRNLTITGNSAASGGGFFMLNPPAQTILSSIVFGNAAISGPDISYPGTLTAGACLIGSKLGIATIAGDSFTNANIGVDPLLGPLVNNGGPTLTYLPSLTSPARNTGSNPAGLTADQRGFSRVSGGGIDIGAVEIQEFVVGNTNDAGADSLRQALLNANATPSPEAVITFLPSFFTTTKTITLTSGELPVTHHVTILGPAAEVGISGINSSRIFNINGPGTLNVAISNVNMGFGKATGSLEGGAVYVQDEIVTFTNCDIFDSTATSGGGGVHLEDAGSLTFEFCNITNNQSASSGGGGIDSDLNGTIVVRNCTINLNTAAAGGAINLLGGGSVTVLDSTLLSNTATTGNGGGIVVNSSGTVTIRGSTLSGNSASGSGGAITNTAASTGTMLIQNTTITNNSAGTSGGGVSRSGLSGPLTLESSIVSGNVAVSNTDINGGTVSANFSAIGSASGFTFSGTSSNNLAFGLDLKLSPLANNGGKTLTHLPAADSPVFNAGRNPAGLTTDQRGLLREIGGIADIGAVEIRKLVVSNTNDAGGGSLRQNVLDAEALSGADTITFDTTVFASAKTITLTSGEMTSSEAMTITGPAAGVTVSGNNASRIFNLAGSSTTTFALANMTLTGGKASSGGAILGNGLAIDLNNCTFSLNSATGGPGGAISVTNDGGVIGLNCTFQGNSASGVGGALAVQGSSNNGGLVLTSSVLSGNTSGTSGGAAYVESLFRVTSCSITGNSAVSGGAFHLNETYFEFLSPSFIANSTVASNSASGDGGAIFITNLATGDQFSVVNSTLTGNTSGNQGGAIANSSSGGTLYIASSIFFGNTAVSAAEISSAPTVAMKGSLLASSNGMSSFAPDSFTGSKIGVDPLLGPLQNNGGLGLSRLPAITSPALSNGISPTLSLTTDQRGNGFPRVRGSAIDIGAVEIPVLVVTNTNDSGVGSLRQAIADSNAVGGADTIFFDATAFATAKTITLATALPEITDSVNIQGTGASLLTVRRDPAAATKFRVLDFDSVTNTAVSTISGMTISGGEVVDRGGGIYVHALETLTLDNVVISGNKASFGGGIAGATSSNLTLNGTTISGNTASSDGGGLYHNTGILAIDNSTIALNTATGKGGGVVIANLSAINTSRIRNSTISGNTAGTVGGGVSVGAVQVLALAVENSTITGNSATTGGGLAGTIASAGFNLNSTIVAANIAGTGPDISAAGKVSAGTSLIGQSAGFSFTDLGGNLPFSTNPLLGPLANNGGLTLTHLPAINSPVINTGSNPSGLTLDQRGLPRELGGLADIGAVEVRNLVIMNTNDSGPGSLRLNILDANSISGPDTITFDASVFAVAKTIPLLSGQMTITENLTITGPSSIATIDAGKSSRVLEIATTGGATITLTNMRIQGGFILGSTGGGLLVSSADTITLDGVSFQNNVGGGISVLAAADLVVRNSSITANTISSGGPGGGAGISATGGGKLLVEQSTISKNIALSAVGGGGIRLSGNFGTNAVVRNSTISGNGAPGSIPSNSGSGGGIHLAGLTGTFSLLNSTVVGNSAIDFGGGINAGSNNIVVGSSIITGNFATAGLQIFTTGTVTATTSLVSSKSGVTTFNGDSFTNSNIGKNPDLGPLTSNGGPTLTHMPAATSLAVNNGSNPAGLTTDQRGFTRVVGGAIDIGAVETRSFLVTNTNNSGAGSLRQAILDTNSFAGTDIIAFDPIVFSSAKTISLSTGQMTITGDLEIQGPDATVTIDAQFASRHFNLGINLSLVASNLKLVNGKDASSVGGSAISSTGKSITLTNCTISNNTATGIAGGAIQHALNTATLTLIDCTISFNSSLADGGAIALDNFNHTLTILGSSLFSNTSGGLGGAAFVTGDVFISNSTLAANSALGSGGAISISHGGATIRNSTLTSNVAGSSGGGLHRNNSFAPILIDSSILFGNTGITGPDLSGAEFTVTRSLLGSKSGTASFTGDAFTSAQIGRDPQLGPLTNNGGPTLTRIPLNTSPAINTGSNPDNLVNDQRGNGFPRVVGTAIDIGAVEFTGIGFSVNNNEIQRSRITAITLHFSTPVNAATLTGLGAITLTRTAASGSGVVGTLVQTGAIGANGRVLVSPLSGSVLGVTLTFDNANGAGVTPGVENGSLADGRWQLAIPSLGLTSTLNDPVLRRLFGDSDNNGTVNATDFADFGNFFGTTTTGNRFDFDNNGTINATDFAEFGNRFGITL